MGTILISWPTDTDRTALCQNPLSHPSHNFLKFIKPIVNVVYLNYSVCIISQVTLFNTKDVTVILYTLDFVLGGQGMGGGVNEQHRSTESSKGILFHQSALLLWMFLVYGVFDFDNLGDLQC